MQLKLNYFSDCCRDLGSQVLIYSACSYRAGSGLVGGRRVKKWAGFDYMLLPAFWLLLGLVGLDGCRA